MQWNLLEYQSYLLVLVTAPLQQLLEELSQGFDGKAQALKKNYHTKSSSF